MPLETIPKLDWEDELGLEDIDIEPQTTAPQLDESDYAVPEESAPQDIDAPKEDEKDVSEPVIDARLAELLKEIEEEEAYREKPRDIKESEAEESLSDRLRRLLGIQGALPEGESVSDLLEALLSRKGKTDDSERQKLSKKRIAKYIYEEYTPETPDSEMLALLRKAVDNEAPAISEEERKKAEEEAKRKADESALDAMMREEEAELERERKRREEDEYYDIGEGMLENTDNLSTFELKLVDAPNRIKYFYSELKNELLTYRQVKDRMSASGDSFRQGGNLIAKITLSGERLTLHLAASVEDYSARTYNHYDMSGTKAYAAVPLTIDIGGSLDLQNAKFLIQEAMASHFILYHRAKKVSVNYAAMYKRKGE